MNSERRKESLANRKRVSEQIAFLEGALEREKSASLVSIHVVRKIEKIRAKATLLKWRYLRRAVGLE